jgi:glycine oxidase
MSAHPDILILGGGVIGLSAAYFLAREGATVEVVDKGEFGQEASWAGAGILQPGNPARARTPFDQLRAHSSSLFPQVSAELRERTGIDNGYLRCGGLEFVYDGADVAAEEWRGEGVACEQLDEQAGRRLEPALGSGLGPANYLPDLAQVRNPRHVKALLAACQTSGVRLRPGCPVHGFRTAASRILSASSCAGPLVAGRFVVAAGAWTDALLQPLGWTPGVRPIRGQIALLNAGPPLFRRVLMSGPRYLVPRPDGRVLVGSTEEDVGFRKQTTAGAIHDLIAFATALVPGMADAHVERCWAGLRPGSPDGLPFIGPVPGFDNGFVAAGHFRAGIQLSLGTALVLKELLLGHPPTLSLEPFRLDRPLPPRPGSHSENL